MTFDASCFGLLVEETEEVVTLGFEEMEREFYQEVAAGLEESQTAQLVGRALQLLGWV